MKIQKIFPAASMLLLSTCFAQCVNKPSNQEQSTRIFETTQDSIEFNQKADSLFNEQKVKIKDLEKSRDSSLMRISLLKKIDNDKINRDFYEDKVDLEEKQEREEVSEKNYVKEFYQLTSELKQKKLENKIKWDSIKKQTAEKWENEICKTTVLFNQKYNELVDRYQTK